MDRIASFDIGTSAVKAVLVGRDAGLERARTLAYADLAADRAGRAERVAPAAGEQDAGVWWQAFLAALAGWRADGVDLGRIAAVALSGQMQDLIALDAAGAPVRPAILYHDARAGAAAAAFAAGVGAAELDRVTRNPFDAASVWPKLLHLRAHEPAAWARIASVLVGAKDVVVHRLTGRAVTDPTTAATTGCFDLAAGDWARAWLDGAGVPSGWLPAIVASGDIAGTVTAGAAAMTGLRAGLPVFCGLGDAAATTLGAGIVDTRRSYAYLGTSAWVARVAAGFNPPGAPLFLLPYLGADRRICIAPIANAGGVHRWAVGLADADRTGAAAADAADAGDAGDAARFAAFEREVGACAGDPDLVFLPYLGPERFPAVSPAARGTFSGISATTTRPQLQRAALEGVSLSLRWAFDELGRAGDGAGVDELAVVGGGTRSAVWLQLLADAFDTRIRVPADADLLPCLGAAAVVAVGLGWCDDPAAFIARRRTAPAATYAADAAGAAALAAKSARFRRLHAALAGLDARPA